MIEWQNDDQHETTRRDVKDTHQTLARQFLAQLLVAARRLLLLLTLRMTLTELSHWVLQPASARQVSIM